MYINIGCVLFIFICMMHGTTTCARSDKHAFSCFLQKPKLPSTGRPPTSLPLCFFYLFSSSQIPKKNTKTLSTGGPQWECRKWNRDWECIVMGSVNPSGLLLNAGWDTTSGSPFHPGALLAVALPTIFSLKHSLSSRLPHFFFFLFFFYCLL